MEKDCSVMFSVIMPSFLGQYPTAAKNRNEKIHRAIQSLINQTYPNWELIVISDGCDTTFQILEDHYKSNPKINCFQILKQGLFSGTPRNVGISKAKGEYVIYLDIDDMIGANHLRIIYDGLSINGFPDWVWFDDFEAISKSDKFAKKTRDINKRANHGTCNVCHKTGLAYWNDKPTYLHDFEFVNNLKQGSSNYLKIDCPEYYICHIPNRVDV